jgi:hypothetical protein
MVQFLIVVQGQKTIRSLRFSTRHHLSQDCVVQGTDHGIVNETPFRGFKSARHGLSAARAHLPWTCRSGARRSNADIQS